MGVPGLTRVGALPPIDEHSIVVAAPAEAAIAGAREVVARPSSRRQTIGARVLGCAETRSSGPPGKAGSTLPGFRVASSTSTEWTLEGSHRFSSYALAFRAEPAGDGRSRLRAETRADFPGAAGRGYRALVIGTGAHRRVVRRLLLAAKRRAERR